MKGKPEGAEDVCSDEDEREPLKAVCEGDGRKFEGTVINMGKMKRRVKITALFLSEALHVCLMGPSLSC